MKKLILGITISCITFVGFGFADIQNSFFCTITKDSITVTMERQNNHKCSEYLNVLNKLINTDYQDILVIQKYIEQGTDVDFRQSIRETKRNRIKKMINIKDQIESAVSEFNGNLYQKVKEYLVYSTSSEKSKYKKALKQLESLKKQGSYISPSVSKKMKYISESITVIDNIISATDYDTLVSNYNRYLYLKEKIIGK